MFRSGTSPKSDSAVGVTHCSNIWRTVRSSSMRRMLETVPILPRRLLMSRGPLLLNVVRAVSHGTIFCGCSAFLQSSIFALLESSMVCEAVSANGSGVLGSGSTLFCTSAGLACPRLSDTDMGVSVQTQWEILVFRESLGGVGAVN